MQISNLQARPVHGARCGITRHKPEVERFVPVESIAEVKERRQIGWPEDQEIEVRADLPGYFLLPNRRTDDTFETLAASSDATATRSSSKYSTRGKVASGADGVTDRPLVSFPRPRSVLPCPTASRYSPLRSRNTGSVPSSTSAKGRTASICGSAGAERLLDSSGVRWGIRENPVRARKQRT